MSKRAISKLVREQRLHGYVETSAIRGGPDVDRVFKEAVRAALGLEVSAAAEVNSGGLCASPLECIIF